MVKIKEIYKIIDTNILLTSHTALYAFKPKKDVLTRMIIPNGVLAEIDSFKSEKYFYNNKLTDRARKSRQVAKELDRLLSDCEGDFEKGIVVQKNYIIQSSYDIETQLGLNLDAILSKSNTDSRLVKIGMWLKDKSTDVELITEDITLRNIARAVGINAQPWQDYINEIKVEDIFKGWREIDIDPSLVEEFRKSGYIPLEVLKIDDLVPNEYVYNKDQSFMGRYDAEKGAMVKLANYMSRKSQVVAQTAHQAFLMDALRNPKIDLVFAIGIPGCGKTFLSVDAGIEQCLDYTPKLSKKGHIEYLYKKMLLTRPVAHHKGEQELGYLPGDKSQKSAPWLEPFMDQFEDLLELYGITGEQLKKQFRDGKINTEFLQTMRGRSFHSAFWVVDEAQNYNDDGFETLLTRPGKGIKMAICGDPSQTDIKNHQDESNYLPYYNQLMHRDVETATVFFGTADLCARRGITQRYLKNKKLFGKNLD